MRPEAHPLDLNNLPEDYTRDGKLTSEDSSSSAGGFRKKKSGVREGKDEAGKVYECRFCSLKFCKSQALGGHMNRHRQERETETLNKARQLVFSNDLAPGPLDYISSGQQIPNGGFHQAGNIADPSLPFWSMYPTRFFSTSSPFIPPPPPLPRPPSQTTQYMYTSPPRMISFTTQFPTTPPANDYLLGHVLSATEGNYTCFGAPVGHGFGKVGGRGHCFEGSSSGGDESLHNQEEG